MTGLTFAAPFVLLGLLALPVIWWLLRATPPVPVRKVFGGHIFLENVQNEKDTPARTPWWLLLLRLLAVAFVILGLSGPVLNAADDAIGDGPLLIVVDDSWPAAPYWRERQNAIEALALQPAAANRPTRILTTAGEPELSDPMPLHEAAEYIGGLLPKALLPDRARALDLIEDLDQAQTDVFWLNDGTIGRRNADRSFLRTMSRSRSTTLYRIPSELPMAITALEPSGPALTATVQRIGNGAVSTMLVATSRDGRTLSEVPFDLGADQATVDVPIELPLTLRNEIARISIAGVQSAGATWLVDGGARRIRAGIVTERMSSLLDGGFYITEALAPHAVITDGTITQLATADTGLIILDDVGTLRASDEATLSQWVQDGGILVRFAGPNTANAISAGASTRAPTYPVVLRDTERSFGGALSWAEPQEISDFAVDGPFGDLTIADPVPVRRQVLTRAGNEPGSVVWASLADGTPLVTARPDGRGTLVLFHVTSTPTWSDLPLSGLFPQMLERLSRLASGAAPTQLVRPVAPYRLLNGFGQYTDPPAGARMATAQEMATGTLPPGLYGNDEGLYAVNTYTSESPTLDRMSAAIIPPTFIIRGPDSERARDLVPLLMTLALVLLALDGIALFWRRWQDGRAGSAVAAGLVGLIAVTVLPHDARAQDLSLRPDLDPKAIEATVDVRLAFVLTGNLEVDRISRAGLVGISQEATRRTALEPDDPVGVDIERDDLSVYPLIYWPVTASTRAPSDDALSRLEAFMAGGGLLLIDTMDGERQTAADTSPAGDNLRRILLRMNIPPLEPLPDDHILTKSFYRLDDLVGRNTGGPVWVEAVTALRESTDGVPSLVIGGRDWASAWAVDANGTPLRPSGAGGIYQREMALRTGINMAMVALTGNYKADQVHVQELLDQLGTGP
ncbi:DUF4159 domain-containing protein [Parvularcula sp. LCG005]|uniref:DUF4159 domain-containing protein n=1 Tax=Parvularcula sp. LCG005 TaxID=3078805 RepID=UPI002943A20D|nr:DUF4159 domain-containing protein [Parvularcula sp. LCG005]WOI52035.1 DUF4159 domain-containing protein [Parvularcula sp. LCG005]